MGKTPIGKVFNDQFVVTQEGSSVMVEDFYNDDVIINQIETMNETGRITGWSAARSEKRAA